MENSNARRQQITSCTTPPPPTQSSPRLVRSRSGTNTISTTALNTSQRFNNNNNNRSKSTTKTRPNYKDEDNQVNINPNPLQSINSNVQKKSTQENREGFAKFLRRGIASSLTTRGGIGATKTSSGGRSVPAVSPSAWALSPGRSLASPVAAAAAVESPGSGRAKVKSSSGGVGGVLKYFRAQKKVSPIQEEEFHRFRVLHNKLMQWRFANARAAAAIEATKIVAEEKLLYVWLRIFILRNSITEKRIQMQKLKHEIKLYQILNPQVFLLNQWAKMEKRDQESVGKLVKKLSGISIKLPLVHSAKADVMSIYEAMSMAMDVMEGIELIIRKFHSQVENTLYLITELVIAKKQEKDCWEELKNTLIYVASLLAKETSVRAHCIQAVMESMRSQNN